MALLKGARDVYTTVAPLHAGYLALERESDTRDEFWQGEIFAMSGGSLRHDRMMRSVFDLFRTQVRRQGCEQKARNMVHILR
jgi:hypothetical protein